MKVLQNNDKYKIIVYKEKLTEADVKTWTLSIELRDDKTMPFVQPNKYEQDIKINFTPTRKVKEVKKDETEVAKTTTCPSYTKTCLMTEDGQQKYGQYENQVPVGSPLTTTTAENESK